MIIVVAPLFMLTKVLQIWPFSFLMSLLLIKLEKASNRLFLSEMEMQPSKLTKAVASAK